MADVTDLLDAGERLGPRGAAGAATGAAARVAAARVRERAVLPRVLRQGRRPPGGLPHPRRPRALPLHDQGGPEGELPVRHVRRAPGEDPPTARLQRHHGTPHGRRLYGQRHFHVGRHGGAVDQGGRRPAGRCRPCGVRLWAVHRWSRCALRRRAPGLYGRPRVRRHDGTAGAADPGPGAVRHHGDPVLHAHPAGRVRTAGRGPAHHLAAGGRLRCRALDRADAAGDRGAVRDRRRRHLRAVRGDRPRRRPGVRGDQGRPPCVGGPLLPGSRGSDHG
ncbi:hypothetical protein SCANM63S_08078 [Streptomyces canarius]